MDTFSRLFGMAFGLGITVVSHGALARTYHVSEDGNDANPGTGRRPFATIQQAAAVAEGGDLVLVHAGDYAGFNVDGVHASSASPLVFRALPGAVITLPGPIPPVPPLNTATDTYVWAVWPHAITVQRSKHVVIDGFEATGMPGRQYADDGALLHKGGAAVYAEASRFLTFRNNNFHDNGRWGLFTAFCDDTTVEYNTISGSKLEHGVYLSNSGDRATVRWNRLFGNAGAGLQINADNAFDNADYRTFADPDGVSQFNRIIGNLIFENGTSGGAGINLDGVSDSLIQHNVLRDNHATGIALFQINGRTGSQRNRVLGNVIRMPVDGRWAINILGCTPDITTPDGICAEATAPRLPEWEDLRPIGYASGSTGNVLLHNLITSDSTENGGIYTDNPSLAPDTDSGGTLVSDFNYVVDRFGINSDTVAFDPEILTGQEWSTRTGQDTHSRLVEAATE